MNTPNSTAQAHALENTQERRILMAKVHGAFGVRGELKVESFSEPETALLRYSPLILKTPRGEEHVLDTVRGRPGAKGLVVTLPGIDTREAADALRGAELYVPRSALPPPKPGEYYWVDLEGMTVITVTGLSLGTVSHLSATGANDVLVVSGERERLIPFLEPDFVTGVDFQTRTITVDWDAEF